MRRSAWTWLALPALMLALLIGGCTGTDGAGEAGEPSGGSGPAVEDVGPNELGADPVE